MAGRLNSTRGTSKSMKDDDLESVTSFASGPVSIKPTIKYAWSGSSQVDHDTYHRMLEDYRAAKAKESKDELKIKQLSAQLARTEEAAKRALVRSDQGVKGSTAQQLLDAQRQIQQLQAENSELSSKLAREKKRANDFRAAAEENRRRLEAALKEQRSLVRRLGEAERSLGGSSAARTAARKAAAEQEYWSEEAGRRFAAQQEELVSLRELNHALQEQLAAAVPAETATKFEGTIKELQQLVRFYEQRLTAAGAAAGVDAIGPVGPGTGPDADGCCGSWVLESLTEGGACYLWERNTGRVLTDVPDGHWPRPVGLKPAAASVIQLGCRGRLDTAFRTLVDVLNHRSQSPGPSRNRPADSSSKLAEALQHLINTGGFVSGSYSNVSTGVVDSRDMPALMAALLPQVAYKEVVELLSWLQVQPGQYGVKLGELEAAARSLLGARDAVRQGRDLTINEALLRVRRLLRQESCTVAAAFDEAAGQDGCLGSMQVVELLQQQQLMPDLNAAEARYLLALLHEWDLAGSSRHSLTDVYAALQMLKLVRVPLGALPQAAAHDRPDSRQSTTSTSIISNSAATQPAAQAATPASGKDRSLAGRPQRSTALGPGNRRSNGAGGLSNAAAGTLAGGMTSLKEAYLNERVAGLEAELAAAKAGIGTATSQQVDTLRSEVACYQARLVELENDFLSLDMVANTEVGDYDAEMRKAWFTAAAFKKRYVEHKLELDAIKATAEKMQKALDETHSALHAEGARRMALEEFAAVAKMEAARTKELAAAVAAERAERLKLEKDYLELQSKAFAAPGGALAEVRSLREELLAARRERAMTEAREAELRREISSLKRQLEGVSPEEHRRLMRELGEAQRKLVSCELELRAALDKLEVYRRADNEAAAATAAAAAATPGSYAGVGSLEKSLQPDEGKGEAELRAELAQLRQAMSLEAGELEKMRKLLDTEASISLAAKAALEEAQVALSAAKAEAAQQAAKLRRELDSRDERIRKLEVQLRGAYGGLSRAAMRASAAAAAEKGAGGVRVSRVGLSAVEQSTEGVLQGLGLHENVIELVVAEAELLDGATYPDASTFLTWDFFLHDSQATPLATGLSPTYNTTVQYIVEADTFLLDYLSQQQLALELFEARGLEAAAVGVAHLPLQLLLQDLEVGAGLGAHTAWHYVGITGARGQQLGRLRVGLRVAKPMDKLLMEYKAAKQQQQAATAMDGSNSSARAGAAAGLREVATRQDTQQPQQPQEPAGDGQVTRVLQEAADQADAEPAKAAHLLITVHRCEGLQQEEKSGTTPSTPPVQSPYVHYTAPGRLHSHDTAVGSGASPVFEDAASWALVRSQLVQQALAQHQLQVAVFDDAVADPVAALVGVASISLTPLAEGIPVEGLFGIIHPHTGQPAGRVAVSIAWHNPLAAAAAGTKQLKARIPLLDTGAVVAAAAAGLQQQEQQQQQQQQQQQMAPTWIQQQPQVLLPSVPMLPVTSAVGSQVSLPNTNPAAAAVVAAAIGRQQQQQQQQPQVLLLQGGSAGDPAAAFADSTAGPGQMLLLQGQQLASVSVSSSNNRYSGINQLNQSLEGPMLGPNAAAAAMNGQAMLPQHPAMLQLVAGGPNAGPVAGSSSSSSSSAPVPVMRHVSPASEAWSDFDSTIYFQVESLIFTGDALRDAGLQHILLAHMFLEDFTSAAQQCTPTLPKGPGPLAFNYCVAYSVADPVSKVPTAAGQALGQALAAAEVGQAARLVLPILLATSRTPAVTDFSQVECVATCEVDLSAIWQGAAGDVISREFEMLPADEKGAQYPSGSTGRLRITLAAARALANLRQQWYGR